MDTTIETLSPDLLQKMNAYWRAANYLSVGQIYLYDNPLLNEPLKPEHTKPMLLGHWGTTPGQDFIYVHLNHMPDFHDHAVHVPSPGAVSGQDTMVLGNFLKDVATLNRDHHNFRVFGPDETLSNLLGAIFETTSRQ